MSSSRTNNKINYKNSFIKIGNQESPIFIISLDNDYSRRNELKNFFSTDIIDNYFPATDVKKSSRVDLDKFCDKKSLHENLTYARDLGAGEIGCCLSHRRIYQYLIDNALPYAIIFEDDVLPVFKSKWLSVLSNALEIINSIDTDKAILIHMGLPYFRSVRGRRIFFLKGYSFSIWPDVRLIEPDTDNKFWLSHAYIITNKAAKRILDCFPLISCVCDDWMVFYKKKCFDIVFLTECAFHQNYTFQSNIRSKHPNLFHKKTNSLFSNFFISVKKLMRKTLDFVLLFFCLRWRVLNLKNHFTNNAVHQINHANKIK